MDKGGQLKIACDTGNLPSVRSLVSSGASVDYQGEDIFGGTPAIYCCYKGHSEILQFLLEQGANAELADIKGSTPLIYAARYNKYECAAVLVRHGVVLDAINTYGCTALYYASRGGYLSIVQLLVQSGADIDRADNDGQTPIVVARKNNRTAVVTYLTIEGKWQRRRNYATVLNSLKGAPTKSNMMRAFQCYDVARVIGSYL
jgi:ankyrin repeat protein